MRNFWLIVFLIGFLLIGLSLHLFFKEYKEAEEYCKSINGTFEFKVSYLCDGDFIYKFYKNGKNYWGFDIELPKELNISIL